MISKLLPYLFLAILLFGFILLFNGLNTSAEVGHSYIIAGAINIAGASIALAINNRPKQG